MSATDQDKRQSPDKLLDMLMELDPVTRKIAAECLHMVAHSRNARAVLSEHCSPEKVIGFRELREKMYDALEVV